MERSKAEKALTTECLGDLIQTSVCVFSVCTEYIDIILFVYTQIYIHIYTNIYTYIYI